MDNSQEQVIPNEQIKYKKRVKFVVGLFFCLLSVFGAINYGVVAEFITWMISLFVGGYFSYVVYAFLFVLGITIIFYKKKNKYKLKLIISGIILIFIGSIILFTTAVTTYQSDSESYLSISSTSLVDELLRTISIDSFPTIDYSTNCGIIGFFLVALINTALTHIGSYIIGAFFVILGFIFVIYKLLKRLFKRILSKEYDMKVKEIIEEPIVKKEKVKVKKNKIDKHLSSSDTVKFTSFNDNPIINVEKEDIEPTESFLEKIDIETSLSKRPTRYQKKQNETSDLKKAIYESSLYKDEDISADMELKTNQNSSLKNDNMYDAVKSFAMGQEYLTVTMIINTFNIGVNKASKIFSKLQEDGIIDINDEDEEGSKVLIHTS